MQQNRCSQINYGRKPILYSSSKALQKIKMKAVFRANSLEFGLSIVINVSIKINTESRAGPLNYKLIEFYHITQSFNVE